jgi:cysteine synthase A
VKDRVALRMIEDAENRGVIMPGDTLLETSSGNTGIALAGISKIKGYKMIVLLPRTASPERLSILKRLGAVVLLYNPEDGRAKTLDYAKRLSAINGWKMLNQYENQANVQAHNKTGEEIILKLNEDKIIPDFLVLGIGTGGTITGISQIMKKEYPNLKIIGLVPEDRVEGLRGFDDFKPPILDLSLIDEIVKIKESEAKEGLSKLMNEYGISAGISSGAVFFASKQIAEREDGKNIVTLFPDGIEKYLSYI